MAAVLPAAVEHVTSWVVTSIVVGSATNGAWRCYQQGNKGLARGFTTTLQDLCYIFILFLLHRCSQNATMFLYVLTQCEKNATTML
jgi:hypothetical protein